MNNRIQIILVSLFLLTASIQHAIAQDYIGDSRHSVVEKLIKSTYKITKNTDEKIIAEFPNPKALYEYYFQNNICYKYEGLIPVTERDFYVNSMKNNGWINFSNSDVKTEIYKKGGRTLKIITLNSDYGYFKFQIE